MIDKAEYFLVIGAGSIGERYIRNLWTMGYTNIVVLRSRNLPFRDIGLARVRIVKSWEEVERISPKVAFVCTPTSMHLENALRCVTLGMHVLVEKPLSHTIDGLSELRQRARENGVLVQVGYMMRYHPFLEKVHAYKMARTFGNLLRIHSHWGEYLPDWHPWEDYRQSYAAKRTLGGGVSLTLSHDLDLSNWIAGDEIVRSEVIFNFRSGLEVDVEAGADFILEYQSGITSHVHLNFFQKVKERYYHYIFDEAVIKIDYFDNEMRVLQAGKQSVERLDDFDRNQLFISQLNEFFTNTEYAQKSDVYISESEKIINLCTINE